MPLLWLALSGVAGSAEVNWNVSNSSPCYMYTPTKSMDDGQGETSVMLRLDAQTLHVSTRSNIDAEFHDLGISVDDKEMIMADSVVKETDVVFEKDLSVLVEQFIAGRNARLQLRFWPTWPTTGPKTVDFSLIGFTKAHNAMKGCQ